MSDWDTPFDDPTPGQSGMAFIALLAGFAWLICLPFDLIASLRNRTNSDDGGKGADRCGAEEGGIINHSQLVRTGSELDHV